MEFLIIPLTSTVKKGLPALLVHIFLGGLPVLGWFFFFFFFISSGTDKVVLLFLIVGTRLELRIVYVGELNDRLTGFYRSRYKENGIYVIAY